MRAVHLQLLSLGLSATDSEILNKMHILRRTGSDCGIYKLMLGLWCGICGSVCRDSLAYQVQSTLTLCSDAAKAQEGVCELYS